MDSSISTAEKSGVTPWWVFAVFFVSGFSALVYQVVWQRSLFSIYGINVESVTIVVTAFMLGLGLGSLAGGEFSKKKWPVLLVFGIIEFSIGLFGVISIWLFSTVGSATLHLPIYLTGLFTFLLILFPTVLMGSTLPLLVSFLVKKTGNVGDAVGTLYFINTLGSAFASVLTVVLFLKYLGQSGSVVIAVILNLTAGGWVIAQHYMQLDKE